MTFRMRDAEYAPLAKMARELDMSVGEMIRTTVALAATVYGKGGRVRAVADQLADAVAEAVNQEAKRKR